MICDNEFLKLTLLPKINSKHTHDRKRKKLD